MPPISVHCGLFRREVAAATEGQTTNTDVTTSGSGINAQLSNKSIRSLERAYELTIARVDYLWDSYNEDSSSSFINSKSLYVIWQLNVAYKDFPYEWQDIVIRALMVTEFPRLAVEAYLKHTCTTDAANDEETYRWAENLFGVLINYSEASEQLRKVVGEAGTIESIIKHLSKHEEVIAAAKVSRRQENLLNYMMTLLYNLSSGFRVKARFAACGAKNVIAPYFDYLQSSYIRVVSVMCGARIESGWPEACQLWNPDANGGALPLIFEFISSAAMNENRRYQGISVDELAECLRLLAVSDNDKELLVSLGILRYAGMLLNSTVEAEQSQGIDLLFAVCLGKNNKSAMCLTVVENEEDCMEPLRYIAESVEDSSEELKEYAMRFLAYVRQEASKLRESDKRLVRAQAFSRQISTASGSGIAAPKQKPTVYLSYHKDDEKTVKRIERLLIGNDFKVVSSTWLSLEDAISKASIVAICHSPSYNMSPTCRRQAELAVSSQKKIVSVQLDLDYQPEWWLRQLLDYSLVCVEGDESLTQMGSGSKLLQQLALLLSE